MRRFCESFADETGELIVDFWEIRGARGPLERYGHFVAFPTPGIETAYACAGPFGERSGCIGILRVVR
jgi:hypothetical protein